MIYFAYAMTWISTSAAVIAGVYFMHSAWCLWALTFPALTKLTQKNKDEEGEGVEYEQSED